MALLRPEAEEAGADAPVTGASSNSDPSNSNRGVGSTGAGFAPGLSLSCSLVRRLKSSIARLGLGDHMPSSSRGRGKLAKGVMRELGLAGANLPCRP